MIARQIRLVLIALAACAAAGACTPHTTSTIAATDAAGDGRVIAETQCGSCHAPGRDGASARADAPPLRSLFSHYRPDTLSEEFLAGIKVGHPDMPLFDLNPQGVDSLVVYLKSIQEPPRPGDHPR